jgi:YegS/Rv2252/BmrU family lipid kinase
MAEAETWILYNPSAGRGDPEVVERITRHLGPHRRARIVEVGEARDPIAAASDALRQHAARVVAAGGDGTVSAVASVLAGSGVPLGILPLGTASSIAVGLGIPADLEAAIDNTFHGEVHAIDTARVAGRRMVLHASVGLHAKAIAETSSEDKSRFGALAYAASALRELTDLQPFDLELETQRETIRCRAVSLMLANLVRPANLLAQGPATSAPADGRLEVTIVAASSLLEAVATGLHLLRSALFAEAATRDDVGYLSVDRLRVRAAPAQPLLIDGDDAGSTPFEAWCEPRSLEVIVPRPPPAAGDVRAKIAGLPALEVEPKHRGGN